MNDLERALVDLVRMGLRGDADSVRQYGRRLLRRVPGGQGPEGDFREALGEVLLEADSQGPALRRGDVARAPDRKISGTAPAPQVGRRPSGFAALGGGRGVSGAAMGTAADIPVDDSSALRLVRVDEGGNCRRPVLPPAADAAVLALVEERRRVDALAALGVAPSRTVLLTGAPGVGKTMTAAYLASELQVPLVQVDLAAVMSSFLGRTGQNLRQVLDYARGRSCVLLLDEFDALAKRRDDQTDVGELKRIVNVLLLELEFWPSDGLLVAATNHPELLDRAIWRRFDLVISLELPDVELRRQIIEDDVAAALGASSPDSQATTAVMPVPQAVLWLCALVTDGASGSDLSRFVRAALREAALTGRSPADTFVAAARNRLTSRGSLDPSIRARVARLFAQDLGWTQRAIGELLGVSHVTVGNWLRARGEDTHTAAGVPTDADGAAAARIGAD